MTILFNVTMWYLEEQKVNNIAIVHTSAVLVAVRLITVQKYRDCDRREMDDARQNVAQQGQLRPPRYVPGVKGQLDLTDPLGFLTLLEAWSIICQHSDILKVQSIFAVVVLASPFAENIGDG